MSKKCNYLELCNKVVTFLRFSPHGLIFNDLVRVTEQTRVHVELILLALIKQNIVRLTVRNTFAFGAPEEKSAEALLTLLFISPCSVEEAAEKLGMNRCMVLELCSTPGVSLNYAKSERGYLFGELRTMHVARAIAENPMTTEDLKKEFCAGPDEIKKCLQALVFDTSINFDMKNQVWTVRRENTEFSPLPGMSYVNRPVSPSILANV